MPKKHAVLSASGAHRWMMCPRSARLEQKFPDDPSPYAAEGTEAHALAEAVLTRYLKGGDAAVSCPDKEMQEAVQQYVDVCIEKIGEARAASADAQILVEEHLDFSRYVPHGFGTGDMVMVSDKYFEVVDLKYGKGVPVSAVGNPQIRLYALGMYEAYGWLYGADEARMTIVQPRLDSVSTEILPCKELVEWGERLRKIAILAYSGKGKFCAGEHCRFCRARRTCRARSDYMLSEVREDLMPGPELKDDEISSILQRAKLIKNWLDDIESYAHGQALEGKVWPGMKLVEGRSVRKITDDALAVKRLEGDGHPAEDIFKPAALRSITDLEKLCGKKHFTELMEGLIDKPKGKPALVPESDKRPAMEIHDIREDFDDSLL